MLLSPLMVLRGREDNWEGQGQPVDERLNPKPNTLNPALRPRSSSNANAFQGPQPRTGVCSQQAIGATDMTAGSGGCCGGRRRESAHLQHWRLQHPAGQLRHLRRHRDAKGLRAAARARSFRRLPQLSDGCSGRHSRAAARRGDSRATLNRWKSKMNDAAALAGSSGMRAPGAPSACCVRHACVLCSRRSVCGGHVRTTTGPVT